MLTLSRVLIVVGIFPAFGSVLVAQPRPLQSRYVSIEAVDSGVIRHNGQARATRWRGVVHVPGAQWIRLKFQTAHLGHHPVDLTSSQLVMTSLLDGATQYLDATSIRQWRNTSAYFNGDSVAIELLAYPNDRSNRIVINEVIVDDPNQRAAKSICGATDDRIPSYDVRSGRVMPVGCTAWIFDDAARCLMTAGHCMTRGDGDVVEFNVPESLPNGNVVHPPPKDQYAVDEASLRYQFFGTGYDWAYFGCFPNSTTGLRPDESQGDYYILTSPPSVDDQSIRITGYGVTDLPVPHEWNQIQKTHVGPYDNFTSTTLSYNTDTTDGNSGSPVILEETGEVIGVHTGGGCLLDGGANVGTGSNNEEWVDALNEPRGVCSTLLSFDYPDGRVQLIDPAGGTTTRVEVSGVGGAEPMTGTGKLYYSTGGSYEIVDLVEIMPNIYDVVFPAVECGQVIKYFIRARTLNGEFVTDPFYPETSNYMAVVGHDVQYAFLDDFEQDLGWTVDDFALSDGTWERGIPAGDGTRGDPLDDFDGSGQCYLTSNVAGDSDVDGGPTVLTSPVFGLSASDAIISYARWHDCYDSSDQLVVQISNDDGLSWSSLESVNSTGSWVKREFMVSEVVEPTDRMRVRFAVADRPDDSITESAIDAFQVIRGACSEVNCGAIDGAIARCYEDLVIAAVLDSSLPEGSELTVTNNGADAKTLVIDDQGQGFVWWPNHPGPNLLEVVECPAFKKTVSCEP